MFFRALLFLLLFCGLLSVSAEPQQLPKDMPYSDENTGMVFPARLGAFRKTEIRISGNPAVGTRIQYSGSRIGCAATIYIYALDENPRVISLEEFERHYRQVRQSVLNLKKLSRKVEEVESIQCSHCSDPDDNPVLREQFQLRTAGEEVYHSELLLILCGDRILKLRITVPASEKIAVRECGQFVERFCRLFFQNKPAIFKPYDQDKTEPAGNTGKADIQPKS